MINELKLKVNSSLSEEELRQLENIFPDFNVVFEKDSPKLFFGDMHPAISFVIGAVVSGIAYDFIKTGVVSFINLIRKKKINEQTTLDIIKTDEILIISKETVTLIRREGKKIFEIDNYNEPLDEFFKPSPEWFLYNIFKRATYKYSDSWFDLDPSWEITNYLKNFIEPTFLHILSLFQNNKNTGLRDNLIFEFIPNSSINACAFMDDKKNEYIGLFYGFPLRFIDINNYILSNGNFFSKIGESINSSEIFQWDFISLIESIYEKDNISDWTIMNNRITDDPEKSKWSIETAWGAGLIIMSHEIGHIIRGHLYEDGRLDSNSNASSLFEFDTDFCDESSYDLYEIDADYISSKILIITTIENSGFFKGNEKDNISKMVYSIIFFFYVISLYDSNNEIKKKTLLHRFNLYLYNISEYLEENRPELLSHFVNEWKLRKNEFEKLWNHLSISSPYDEGDSSTMFLESLEFKESHLQMESTFLELIEKRKNNA